MTTILHQLIGKTLTKCSGVVGGETIIFQTIKGEIYQLFHRQSCCESVLIEDICGDLSDLVGSPIIQAEKNTSDKNPPNFKKRYQNSFTWTFYRFATVKGTVVIRWYGESNGCYSEDVDFREIESRPLTKG